MSISSSYNQDWIYVETLFNELNIKYSIKKIKREKSSYSIIRITNKKGIKNFGDYIYENYEIDKIGLSRKYEKYQQIINN
jgi:hypothetical protein